MKKLLIFFPIFLFFVAAAPTLLTGKIVTVSDGDTVTLLTADKGVISRNGEYSTLRIKKVSELCRKWS